MWETCHSVYICVCVGMYVFMCNYMYMYVCMYVHNNIIYLTGGTCKQSMIVLFWESNASDMMLWLNNKRYSLSTEEFKILR